MNQESKQFLQDLITTPSPSGAEYAIQQKWINYTKQFAHKIQTDAVGNVIACLNPNNEFKVMLAGHCDEIAFVVSYIDDNGFLSVIKAGGISHKIALGMRVKVLGKNGPIYGVVGVPAEHHGGVGDNLKLEDIYIDCGAIDKEDMLKHVNIGDYVIYDTNYSYMLNDNIVGRGLDNKTGAFIVAEVLKRVAKAEPKVGVYAVSTVNEETNMGGAYFASSSINPTLGIACDVTFATDYPNVNNKKHGTVKIAGGPVLAKGAPINPVANSLLAEVASKNNIPVQYELTPRSTGTDADKIRVSCKGVPVALVSLPIRYMHSPVELANTNDIEQEIEILTQFILSLTGEEDFRLLKA
ncbi:M20/M25/M40 family metallo-hydrolase [Clostridium sp. 'deep sea']|uniref:M20/M25/M40 family metallo-hydrolase n=1 Tax=Clostridium sp. 'deep sea' TaxID=2779445 RepID=UPI0018968D43|nr:M20/M25/M40 family metallo-hydrolase [Clostridium sp. 'deep sea']QOR34729.1 M20/M25/M40 family metallo-hydrolase [Clostridium sp. 'deep sea']